MNIFRKFISINVRLSKWFDRTFLPQSMRLDGNGDYLYSLAPSHLTSNLKVYDIGGGKQPYISLELKKNLNLSVVGLDISQDELDLAPMDAYDEKITADISTYEGCADGDLVICQAVLEHVKNTDGAFNAIASILKPGGKALIFVPSRNAVFARLNLILPQNIKRKILHTVFPSTAKAQGFPSFYNNCTPNDFVAMSNKYGMQVVEARYYYISSYFSFLFPLYFIWRLWVLLFRAIRGNQAAETFALTLVKNK